MDGKSTNYDTEIIFSVEKNLFIITLLNKMEKIAIDFFFSTLTQFFPFF